MLFRSSLLSAVPQPDPISESVRQRVPYQHQEPTGDVRKYEISPEHFVYADAEQLQAWTK